MNTSYEAALVTLLSSDGANVVDTQSVQSPVSLTDLSPATDYSLEIAFLFTGGHTGPRTRRQVTTLDGSECRLAYLPLVPSHTTLTVPSL